MNLRTVVQTESLFARRDRRVVRALVATAVSSSSRIDDDDDDDDDDDEHDAWRIGDGDGEIDFLPLTVRRGDTTCYVSYNGGDLGRDDGGDGDGRDVIGLHPDVLSVLTMDAFSSVTVRVEPLPFVRNAVSVEMEPLDASDWEILECRAAWLENGGLLSLVSVVGPPGQRLTLRPPGDARGAQVRVTRTDGRGVVRLVADTRVSIVPKERPAASHAASPPLRVVDVLDDDEVLRRTGLSLCREEEEEEFDRAVFRRRAVLHPDDAAACLPGWNERTDDDDDDDRLAWVRREGGEERVVVGVAVSRRVPRDCAALPTLVRYQPRLSVAPLYDRVCLRLMTRVEAEEHRVDERTRVTMRPISFAPSPSDPPWRRRYLASSHDDGDDDDDPFGPAIHDGTIVRWSTNDTKENDSSSLGRLYRVEFDPPSSDDDDDDVGPARYLRPADLLDRLSPSASPVVVTLPLPPSEHRHRSLVPRTVPSHVGVERLLRRRARRGDTDLLLLRGDPGSGRTHAVACRAVLDRASPSRPRATVWVDGAALRNASTTAVLDALTDAFDEAERLAPSLAVLDDLDAIAPGNESGVDPGRSRAVADHVARRLETRRGDVRCWATCVDPRAVRPALRTWRTFGDDTQASLPTWTGEERYDVFRSLLGETDNDDDDDDDGEDLSLEFQHLTEGSSARDLCALASEVRDESWLTKIGRRSASLSRRDRIRRTLSSRASASADNTVRWSDVGGLVRAKRALTDALLRPRLFRPVHRRIGNTRPKHLLLFGPSGAGKSLLARALATAAGLRLVVCRGPELLDRYVGASEAAVRRLFRRAAAAAPALLLLDDLEAAAPRRGTDATGVTDRVVNQLLTLLDGVESARDDVVVAGATSRPDRVDPALTRPGRLETRVYVGPPEDDAERCDVLRALLEREGETGSWDPRIAEALREGAIFEDDDDELRDRVSWTPADLVAALDAARSRAVRECAERDGDDVFVTLAHLRTALRAIRPSVSREEHVALHRRHYDAFLNDDDRARAKEMWGRRDDDDDDENGSGSSSSSSWDPCDGASSSPPRDKDEPLRTALR